MNAEEYIEEMRSRMHDIAGYLHTLPRDHSLLPEDIHLIGDQLKRLSDLAYVVATEAGERREAA